MNRIPKYNNLYQKVKLKLPIFFLSLILKKIRRIPLTKVYNLMLDKVIVFL